MLSTGRTCRTHSGRIKTKNIQVGFTTRKWKDVQPEEDRVNFSVEMRISDRDLKLNKAL